MADRIAEVIVIAEDVRSRRFLDRYVKRAVEHRRIRLVPLPKGHQSGYDWVLQHYLREVKTHRGRVKKGKGKYLSALVIHIDADNNTVERRHAELAESLRTGGESPRTPTERIAVVVPRRNTETWLYGLSGVAVDESYDFKRDPEGRIPASERKRCDARIDPASEELYRLTRPNAPSPPESMPALSTAVGELRRLET